MRIPTLLALALLAVAITLGIFLAISSHRVGFSQPVLLNPSGIQVVNVTSNQATVIWQTKEAAEGLITYGETPSLGSSAPDDRDEQTKPHITHFVTLKNLKENTTYYLKVRSNLNFYPENPLQFKTAQKPASISHNRSIFGVIVRSDLQPIDEAIILLHVNGGSDVATVTTTAGNFILPLSNLVNSSLSDNLNLDQATGAKMIVERSDVKSNIKLSLPVGNRPLPKIVLGSDYDFSSLVSLSSPSPTTFNSFDLNHDGKINSLDLSILLQSLGKTSSDSGFNAAADFNHDGVIDQNDVDLMKKAMSQ